MEETFAQFRALIEGQGFTLEQLGFLPGADASEINGLEEVIGRSLPEGLRYWLSQVNGQEEDGLLFLPGCACARLLSCKEIATAWEFGKEQASREGAMDYYDRFQDGDRIRGLLYSPDWIVLASEAGIVQMTLDFDPGPAGRAGQVITDVSEVEFMVLADSFEAYFAKIVRLMASGDLVIGYSDDFECHILGHGDPLDLVDAETWVQ